MSYLFPAEAVDGALPAVLRHIALQRLDSIALLVQVAGQRTRPMLGAGEDQGPPGSPAFEHGQQQLLLEPAGHRIERMRNRLGRGDHADLNRDRIAQDAVRQLADVIRHGGREEQRLALDRHQFEDAADVGQEAHVAHAVGLVQHQHLDLRQVDAALGDQVEQASGAGDDDLGAAAQRLHLRALAHAAVDGDAAQVGAGAIPRAAWWICSASSRVGARISARTPRPGWVARCCRIGSMNAAVLPVPVWAIPIRSRPVRMGGMA